MLGNLFSLYLLRTKCKRYYFLCSLTIDNLAYCCCTAVLPCSVAVTFSSSSVVFAMLWLCPHLASSLRCRVASLPYSMSVHDHCVGRLDTNGYSLFSAFPSTSRKEWIYSSPTRSSVSLSLACPALGSVVDLRGLQIDVHQHPKWP